MKQAVAGAAELLARCRANAVRAKRAGREARWRCPACEDTGWTFDVGVTYGGHSGVEVASRCRGPALTGCPWQHHEDERRPTKKATRGRMG